MHNALFNHQSLSQAIRFSIVGLISNLSLYVIFLILVDGGFDSKIVVTLLYIAGLSVTFIFNKRWSFSHRGRVKQSVKRYLTLYGALYLTNMLVLWVSVDFLSQPHAVVQAFVVATFIPIVFFAQRYWVFPIAKQLVSDQERI